MEKQIDKGHLHPLTLMINEINAIFSEMGFVVAQGPEVETEFYNFDALNIPADHPARDMQDTFWLKGSSSASTKEERRLLRTHTSPVQIRYMQSHKPPFRIVVPGKVFRNEATDATHEAEFYQVEGLIIDHAGTVSLAQLKGVLTEFFKRLFGPDASIRFRPSFFPFTEPSVEVDVLFKGKWLEMMGAGLVHPNVLRAGGIEPADGKGGGWQGFAFGGGIDRLVMVKHGIDDIRLLYAGDLRLVNQF